MQKAIDHGFKVLIILFSIGFTAAPSLGQDPVAAPEGIPVESNWLYRKHYAQVQEIMKAPLAQREGKLTTYYNKLHQKAQMRKNMSGFFGQVVNDYKAAGKTAEAEALTSRMMELFPHLKPSPEQELQQAYQSKDYARVIQLGEKQYASKPASSTAAMLAHSYIATKNGPKAVDYSQKALQALGTKEGAYFAVWLAEYYRAQQDVGNALKYYSLLTRAFPNEGPPGWEARHWYEILESAHNLKATDAYLKDDFKTAIESYYESLKYNPKNEQAYLFIGLAHWKQQEMDEAMGAFAMASVLDRPGSAKARGYLEQIYKARNSDSLDGLDDLLDGARQALNQ